MEQWGSSAQQGAELQRTNLRDLHNKVVALYPLQHVKQWWMPGGNGRPDEMKDAGECDLIIYDPNTGNLEVRRNVIFFGARMVGLIRTRAGQALLGTVEGDPYQATSLTWKFLDTDTQAIGFITLALEKLPDTEFEMQPGPDGAMVRGSFRRSQPGDYSDRAQPRQGNQQQQGYQPGPGQQGYHGWGGQQQYQQSPQQQWGGQPQPQPPQPQWGQQQAPPQQPQWGQQPPAQIGSQPPAWMQQQPAQMGSQPPAWMQQQAPQPPQQQAPWGGQQQAQQTPAPQEVPQQWMQQPQQPPTWGQPMNPPAAPQPATSGTTMDAVLAQQPPQQQGPQPNDGPPPF